MGTRSSRRHRGTRRGLASFVSFVVLFALALGQGSSLIAWADDASHVDSVATEEVATDGTSADATLPAEEAPAEEAPAEEAPAEEAPAEEAPAEEAPAEEAPAEEAPAEQGSDNSAGTSGGKAGGARTLRARGPQGGVVIQSHGQLHGGDVSLDFVAAGPASYNHTTGVGGEFGAREIGPEGVVESLEGGDFECGDLVVFFTEVAVADDAEGTGSIELDYSFGAETTGQPGVGFIDIESVSINTGDSAMDSDGNETATLTSEQTVGDELLGSVLVTGLSAGETVIVRLVVELGCEVGDPTGNLLNSILDADVVGGDNISVGNETVPMKQVGDVAQPGMNVDKTCPATGQVGDTITYTISIQNTGNETLNLTSVVDTVNGHPPVNITASFPTTIAAATTVTRTYSYTVVAADPDPLPNSVAVTAQGATSGATITGSDSCSTDILHPAIDVTKTCTATAQVGDVITYTITVKNTGDETLNSVTVNDSLLGNLSGSYDDVFSPGEEESHNFTYTVTVNSPDPVPNTVTASGTGATSSDVVTDTASCSTDILNPGISVTKTCTPSVKIGGTITYTITVSNSSDEPLDGVTVSDSLLGDLSASFADTLAVGASESHDFTYTVTSTSPDPVPNTVTASGTGVTSDDAVTDTASCSTDVLFPAINIVKDGPALVHRGDTITYTFVVTNPGEVELFDVELSDPICDTGTIDPGAEVDASLAVGEVWTFSCTHLVTEEDPDPIPNTATVRGDTEEGEGGNEVTDTDDHVVDIIHPAIDIVKTVDEELVPVGTTVTFTYVITNTGDTTLFDISVDDDILGHIGDIASLEPGASVTLTADFVVGDEPVTNVGTAEGEDILGRSVSADDDAIVSPILGSNPPNPPNTPPTPPTTPFTGSDAGRLGLITIVLFGIGVTVVASTRRRRPEREAA